MTRAVPNLLFCRRFFLVAENPRFTVGTGIVFRPIIIIRQVVIESVEHLINRTFDTSG